MPSPRYRERVFEVLSDVVCQKGTSISFNELLARVRADTSKNGMLLGPRAATYINKVVTYLARTGRVTRDAVGEGGRFDRNINLTPRGMQFFKRLNGIHLHQPNDPAVQRMSIRELQEQTSILDQILTELQDVVLEFHPNAENPPPPEQIVGTIETACSRYDACQKQHEGVVAANAEDRAVERLLLSHLRKVEEGLIKVPGGSSST